MTELLLLVIALGVLATLAIVWRIAADLRALRIEHIPDMLASLRKLCLPLGPIYPLSFHHDGHQELIELDCVTWEWRDGCWQLIVESVPAGVDPGIPPAFPGAFTGERIKSSVSRRGR
jgi:hypothetical protein